MKYSENPVRAFFLLRIFMKIRNNRVQSNIVKTTLIHCVANFNRFFKENSKKVNYSEIIKKIIALSKPSQYRNGNKVQRTGTCFSTTRSTGTWTILSTSMGLLATGYGTNFSNICGGC